MSPTLRCAACGARWHTAARRGRSPATEVCLRCGGPLTEVSDQPLPRREAPVPMLDGLFEAWHAGDCGRLLDLCHPEVEIIGIEALFPGHDSRFHGHAGARRWMELIRELWDLEFRSEPKERRLLDDGSVEQVSEVVARSSGDRPDFSARTRSVWQFEGGKLRRVEFSVARAVAADAPRA